MEMFLSMHIEFARENDFDPICSLLAEDNLPFEDIRINHLKHFMVARDGKQIIGVIGLELLGQTVLLRSLAIRSSSRGEGVGYVLTTRLEKYAASLEVKNIYLLTTTAEGYFSKTGYTKLARNVVPEEIKSISEFRELCPNSAVCMVKHLTNS